MMKYPRPDAVKVSFRFFLQRKKILIGRSFEIENLETVGKKFGLQSSSPPFRKIYFQEFIYGVDCHRSKVVKLPQR